MIKKILSSIAVSLALTVAHSQETEFQVQLNSGLFSFSGASADRSTFINASERLNHSYTNNPYGSRSGLSLGASANLKRVTKRNFLYGVDLGYEVLRSKVDIDAVFGDSATKIAANGRTFLNLHFINANPYLGYRSEIGRLPVDFMGGFDVGYCLAATEKGKATTIGGVSYEMSRDRSTIKVDVRPRLQVATRFNKFGCYAGYSFGLASYASGMIGGSKDAFARFFRFGITYRIN